MLGKTILLLLIISFFLFFIGLSRKTPNDMIINHSLEKYTNFATFEQPNADELPDNKDFDGHQDDWERLYHQEETKRRQRDLNNARLVMREIDSEHVNGFVLQQPVYSGESNTSDAPVCLPSEPLERKPVHLENTYASPDANFSVGYLLPRFNYEEFREYSI